jgi:galactose-1-phosphate uridylyltransferase
VKDDFHWHFEIYPELDGESGHFDAETFYYNPVPPEDAAIALRAIEPVAVQNQSTGKSE